MAIGALTPADKTKITGLIMSGVDTLREIATLREGMKDSVGSVADELDIEKRYIRAAINAAYKSAQQNQNVIEDAQEQLDAVELLLKAAGM